MSFLEKFKRKEEPHKEHEHKEAPDFPEKTLEVQEIPDREDAHDLSENPQKEELFHSEGQLAVDAYETEQEFCIQAPVAGVRARDIEVTVDRDHITIHGTRSKKKEKEGVNYFFQECYWGAFSRQIILPKDVDTENAEATFENGILTIRIPKKAPQEARKLEIKRE